MFSLRASRNVAGAGVLATTVFMFAGLLATPASIAETLGQVTAVERNPNAVVIGGERFRVSAATRLFEVTESSGEETVITWQSISVGDFVLYEANGAVLKTLQRMNPAAIDAAPPSPLQIDPGR